MTDPEGRGGTGSTHWLAYDIPASVSVFDRTDIDRAGIRDLRGIADQTPNFGLLDNYRPGLERFQLRGIITPQVSEAGEQAAAASPESSVELDESKLTPFKDFIESLDIDDLGGGTDPNPRKS